MRACLKMDPRDRLTVEQALKHPYLLPHSLEDNEFQNDELNLLTQRKPPVKNESKASLLSIRDEEDHRPPKTKFFSNKPGLKLEAGSLAERDIIAQTNGLEDGHTAMLKKKSHTNLAGKLDEDSPIGRKPKKLSKMMSEEKNLKLNVDLNVKINLKIGQRGKIEERLESKLGLQQSKSKLLPEIKANGGALRQQLKVRQK